MCVSVSLCVCERESVCVCVCVCVRERERERSHYEEATRGSSAERRQPCGPPVAAPREL